MPFLGILPEFVSFLQEQRTNINGEKNQNERLADFVGIVRVRCGTKVSFAYGWVVTCVHDDQTIVFLREARFALSSCRIGRLERQLLTEAIMSKYWLLTIVKLDIELKRILLDGPCLTILTEHEIQSIRQP